MGLPELKLKIKFLEFQKQNDVAILKKSHCHFPFSSAFYSSDHKSDIIKIHCSWLAIHYECKSILDCLFSVHNVISLSRHKEVYLMRLLSRVLLSCNVNDYAVHHYRMWICICGYGRKQHILRTYVKRSCSMQLINLIIL